MLRHLGRALSVRDVSPEDIDVAAAWQPD